MAKKNPRAAVRKRVPARARRRTVRAKATTRVGRTPKFAVGNQARANDKAPRDYSGRDGTITEIGAGQSEFRVEFEDGRQPTTGYLKSSCLDKM